MGKLPKAAGLLLLAASSVYSDRAAPNDPARPANPPISAIPAAAVIPANVAPPLQNSAPAIAPAATPVAPIGADVAVAPMAPPTTQPMDPATTPVVSVPAPDGGKTPPQVNITNAGAVEIHVNNANLLEVLRMLSIQSQKNIIASRNVGGAVTANLYDVTVKEALDAILRSNGYDYIEKGNFIYVYTAKEIEQMRLAARHTETAVFRLYYTPASNAVTMIKPVLGPEAVVAFAPSQTGIDATAKDTGGNSHATEDALVITAYPEELDAVRKVLREIDRRPQQILVEAVILSAQLQDKNSLGINFTAMGGVDFNALSQVGSFTNTAAGSQQALTGSIIDNPAAGKINDAGYVGGSLGGNGLQLGIVKNNVGAFISALEGVTDTTILANPKVLVLNKQEGEVHVGSEQGYKTAITTDTTTAQNVQFLETGTRLMFRPFVGDDGYIRMEVHPEDSSGAVNSDGLPNKDETEVTTNVLVRDGHTIVIGGLFRDDTVRTRNQVPGLGSLPGIGALFRSQTDTVHRQEVIILLTPHLIHDESAYTAMSEKELKEAERIRVGSRLGMMPWGRERLADQWYQQAVAEMNKPKPDHQRALWDLNAAIDLNPIFREAIDLKSQVTGAEMVAADNSSIRLFLRNEMMAERPRVGQSSPPAVVPITPMAAPATQPQMP